MRWKPILLAFLLISTFVFWYNFTGRVVYQTVEANVTRVIDGDTIELDTKEHVRLLGINTPEKNQPFHDEAENFLKILENKSIRLEITEKDKYNRLLAYIHFNNELINKKILEEGLANLYYYGEDNYYNEMKKAEDFARNSELGIWKKSNNSNCIKLISLKYLDKGKCNNQEQLILQNNCSKMSIIIKDDANHIYEETVNPGLFTKNYSCIWNDAGDTVYVRDKEGLILFYRY